MSNPEIIYCRQGGVEWFRYRLGIPTASRFKDLLSNPRSKDEKISKTAYTYMLQLLAERVTRELTQFHDTADMQRGKELEPKARRSYTFQTENDVREAGIILNHGVGYSPDGLVGENGLIEIKCRRPYYHIDALLTGEMPDDYKAQVQGGLWVSEREWCDYVSYCPRMRLFIKRIYRDERYINVLSKRIGVFLEELEINFVKIQEGFQ